MKIKLVVIVDVKLLPGASKSEAIDEITDEIINCLEQHREAIGDEPGEFSETIRSITGFNIT